MLLRSSALILATLCARAATAPSQAVKRLDNGLALTPPMGWDSYNHYACLPNQSIVESNAKAMKDFGLADLGYIYVTTDCGWTEPYRIDGKMTWNASLFPGGFPEMGQYIKSLGLKFGVYADGGIQQCMNGLPNQTGSLYHEYTDAATFVSWGADYLKYDNCYSSEAAGYPDADYTPVEHLAPRFQTMSEALEATGKDILYEICEWGVSFPSNWAPEIGNAWRITNDIICDWRTVYRQMNQFVPNAPYGGPGRWPDLDMLEVGNDCFSHAGEQTHFSLWAIAKSLLTIGAALNDTLTTINAESLAILKNEVVIGYNQDSLGKAANLVRRDTEAGYDVWAGPLSGGRTIAALVNWNNETITGTLNLPDVGVQSAASTLDVWSSKTVSNVLTSYTKEIPAFGTLLLELRETTPAGTYAADDFAVTDRSTTTFKNVYGITDSNNYTLTIHFDGEFDSSIIVSTSASSSKYTVAANSDTVTLQITLLASNANTITISSAEVSSISVSAPVGTFYPSTSFTLTSPAALHECLTGFCAPVGSRITNLTSTGAASISVPSASNTSSSRWVELTYINNDIAFLSSFSNGNNARNITVAVNDAAPVRLEVPLSGHHSELFGPMDGWGDPGTLGLLVDGFGTGTGGEDQIVVSNANGDAGVQPLGADFVGLRII